MAQSRFRLPRRFAAFAVAFAILTLVLIPLMDARIAVLLAFDAAALTFLASLVPLRNDEPKAMRREAACNDVAGPVLLAPNAVVAGVVLAKVALELGQKGRPQAPPSRW